MPLGEEAHAALGRRIHLDFKRATATIVNPEKRVSKRYQVHTWPERVSAVVSFVLELPLVQETKFSNLEPIRLRREQKCFRNIDHSWGRGRWRVVDR